METTGNVLFTFKDFDAKLSKEEKQAIMKPWIDAMTAAGYAPTNVLENLGIGKIDCDTPERSQEVLDFLNQQPYIKHAELEGFVYAI